MPAISCILPTYNCERYIKEAIESILNQTFYDFELIIIDDASTDHTVKIIKRYDDPRITFFQKTTNSGITESLNMGLKIAKGEFIARMDGDDISVLDRFEKQIKFLRHHPDVVVVGSHIKIIGSNEIIALPSDPEILRVRLLGSNHMAHPTVMMRSLILKKFKIRYDESFEPAEDYRLWTDLIQVGKVANMAEPLCYYRRHEQQTSIQKLSIQNSKADLSRLRMLYYLVNKDSITEHQKSLHLQLMKSEYDASTSLKEIERWIKNLISINFTKNFFDQNILEAFLKEKQFYIEKYYLNGTKRHSLKNVLYFITHLKNYKTKFALKGLITITAKIIIKNSIWRLRPQTI